MSEKQVIKNQSDETPAAEPEEVDELATVKKSIKKLSDCIDDLVERVELLEKRQPWTGTRQ
jgi:hypothetical protein